MILWLSRSLSVSISKKRNFNYLRLCKYIDFLEWEDFNFKRPQILFTKMGGT